MNELLEKAKNIKCLICDVDGVLTDGQLYIDNYGNELKTFCVQDGMGLKLLMAAGIHVAVITTSQNAVIDHRMKQLGIQHYFKGQVDKNNAFNQLKLRLGFSNEDFAYIGDDLPDLAIIRQVGFGVAVANAVDQVKEFAAWQTEQSGGRGAVREVCDLILNAKQMQDIALARYLAS
ncbi:KdsC family phosphatase [Legionella micdadei]|uniref:3-deoxy-D-manno-octulosonate 8-phosphate phosphatase KdsC n=1 Tax=Legionella micdadei TaxID=451 RepID=A0A098GDJ3_LEGMI|nr:HAD-IIIA family hydrolase [Legionella micdadei]ARG97847.1 3-deoxy-D-manno-octulosonate 8-phosphate phosphatase [Legionella micdadei]ARG99835.1 3-deoxy-D-manno-octulosonate 8-phosphate phosphatase [Legionella micdadei]KTD28563.1 hydrolase [Legionella micdadei]NSL19156.1 HAD-IIIA family hydrolase [Legionella micdadei]CEG60544.1 3-deoxy-D-manno-octulosonate 8-phosphate phosphatase [Legionella micdadei]